MKNKILANQIQQHNEKIAHYVQRGLSQECKVALTFENLIDIVTTLKFKEQNHTIITINE